MHPQIIVPRFDSTTGQINGRVRTAEHLDAADNIFFVRELESISNRMLEVKKEPLLSLQFVPLASDMASLDEAYTYRMFDKLGKAKRIKDMGDDAPMVNVNGTESTSYVYSYAASFGYSVDELQQSAKVGRSLDRMRADAVKRVLDEKLDEIAAVGDSDVGTKGLLNLASTSTFTLGDKTAGGKKWMNASTLLPNATAAEIIKDVFAIHRQVHNDTKTVEKITRFVMPAAQLQMIQTMPRSDTTDTTVLEFIKGNLPGVEFLSWERTKLAGGSNDVDRLLAYDPNEEKVRLVLPLAFEMQAPQLENWRYKVNCRFKCGGVVSPYPKSVCYADDI